MSDKFKTPNEVIAYVIQQNVVQNATEFICRVLYEIVLAQELHCYCHDCVLEGDHVGDTVQWARNIYDIYFDPQCVPALLSNIQCCVQQLFGRQHIRRSLYEKAIPNSVKYLNQKRKAALSALSITYDRWRKEDGLDSNEQMHYCYLYHLQQAMIVGNYVRDAHDTDRSMNDLYAKRLDFFLEHQQQITVCRHLNDHWDMEFHGKIPLKMIMYVLQAVLWHRITDKRFLKQIGKLCRQLRRAARKLDHGADRDHILSEVLGRMAHYYFWHRFNGRLAIECMTRAADLANDRGDTHNLWWLIAGAYEMHHVVRNYKQCLVIIEKQYRYEAISFQEYRRKNDELKRKLRLNGGNTFDESDQATHKKLIEKSRAVPAYVTTMSEPVYHRVKDLFKDQSNFYILRNALMRRECDYQECRRKDVRKLSVCSRCCSAYYCCRLHQKIHWKQRHHMECLD